MIINIAAIHILVQTMYWQDNNQYSEGDNIQTGHYGLKKSHNPFRLTVSNFQ